MVGQTTTPKSGVATTTEMVGQATTPKSGVAATTEMVGQTTTPKSGVATTTEMVGQATTPKSGVATTTEMVGQTTTPKSGVVTTTEMVGQTTTPKSGVVTTTEMVGQTTTPKSGVVTTTEMVGQTSTPKSGVVTTTEMVGQTTTPKSGVVTTAEYSTATPSHNCSWDCKCFVTCQNQKLLAEGELPSRCGTEAATECDLCTCESGYIKDSKTRKCIQMDTGCNRRCVYNGKTIEEGSYFWRGDCQYCQCLDGKEHCQNNVCRLSQAACDEIGQRFVEMPGTCCYCAPYNVTITTSTLATTIAFVTSNPTTEVNNCIYDGVDYNQPSPHNIWENGCNICRCENNTQECSKVCRLEQSSCGDGEILMNDLTSDECCECVAQVCEVDGVYKKFGESWNVDDCVTCSCVDFTTGVHCESRECNATCDVTQTLELVEGECCPKCVDQAPSCSPVAIQHVINLDGCVTEGSVQLTACVGSCASNVTMIDSPPFIQTNCHCCKPDDIRHRNVTLTCPGGRMVDHMIPEILSCACAECAYEPAIKPTQPDQNN
nr:kielin/chordin-like protein [Ciona intestinalis]|eukprot:XP_002129323.4 kielin/chordin-like protein [Ciona intestinalis]